MSRHLILRPGAIGDGIVTLPVVQRVKELQLTAHVELVAGGAVSSLLRGRCAADTISSFEDQLWGGLFVQAMPAGLSRYLADFDSIIFYLGRPSDDLAARLQRESGTQAIVWPSLPPEDMPTHISMHLQGALTALGLAPRAQPPLLKLTLSDRQLAQTYWDDHGLSEDERAVVALHPGSGSPRKNWPARRYAELARRLRIEHDARILVIGGPADEGVLRDLQARLTDSPPLVVRDGSLAEVGALLARCRLLIGNDSGIAHLAAAINTPTIVLFGPSDPRVWAPCGHDVTVVASSGDSVPGQEMTAIAVDRVFAEAQARLL